MERDYRALPGAQTTNLVKVDPTVGARVEWAFDQHWSARLEYRVLGGGSRVEAAKFAQPELATRHLQGESQLTVGVRYCF